MHERDDYDLQLDEALLSYGEARPGLEQRILLHHIETAAATPTRRRILMWAVMVPLAACAMLALLVFLRAPHAPVQVVQAPASTAPLPGPRTAPSLPAPSAPAAQPRTTPPHHAQACPKLDQFPAPSPLTAQEQTLIRFAENTQPAEQIAIADAQRNIAEPLHVPAIRIPPIESPAEGNK